MGFINVEIKASRSNIDSIRQILKEKGADFKGTDHQIDTYFNVKNGRLKLRECNIENNLIFYDRPDQGGPKTSEVTLIHKPKKEYIDILSKSLGAKIIVNKKREIYFIDNIKFHLDEVEGLGKFVEIEAKLDNPNDKERLKAQVDEYMKLFEIDESHLVSDSYSDLLLE